jgi:hypothetical protein
VNFESGGPTPVLLRRAECFPTHTFQNTRAVFVTARVFSALRFPGAMPFETIWEGFLKAFGVPQGLSHRYSGESLAEHWVGWPVIPIAQTGAKPGTSFKNVRVD